MIKVNEYFEGNVKSLDLHGVTGKETVGVMAPGEYEFSTSKKEVITVISGALIVKAPEAEEWEIVQQGEMFEIPAGEKFQVRVYVDTAYLCQYI